jgi:hypothetical protein
VFSLCQVFDDVLQVAHSGKAMITRSKNATKF